MARRRPHNVLIFLVDGLRADALGCGGSPLALTPNIDALADGGVRFERGFAQETVCMPSRASLFTGRYPHVHGVWANGVSLPTSETTLVHVLSANGYRTCAAGKLHLACQHGDGYPPRLKSGETHYGFQELRLNENVIGEEYIQFVEQQFPDLLDTARTRGPMPEEAHELTWIVDQAIDFVRRSVREDAPFFCFCSFHELSPPCHPPIGYEDRCRPEDVPPPKQREGELDTKPPWLKACHEGQLRLGRYPDESRRRQLAAGYFNQLAFIDDRFGRLLTALDETGASEDTVVLFTSDHGLLLNDHFQWRHGPFLYDTVINVPMIWRVPGVAQAGHATSSLAEMVDLCPTILELCGIDSPPGMQGVSLCPLLKEPTSASGKHCVLAEVREAPELQARGLDPTGFRAVALRTERWKLIHYPGRPYGELYDLTRDPDEFDNLWSNPQCRAVRTDLERRLLDRLIETQEPLPRREHNW